MRAVCLSVALTLALATGLAGRASAATANAAVTNTANTIAAASRQKRWQEDLEYFARELPAKHIQFARIVSPEKFEREVREIERAVPELSDSEIVLRLMRQTASLNVAHTRVSWPTAPLAFREYPLAFYWFSDGLAIAAATPEHRQAVGARVLRIGRRTPKEVQKAVAAFIAHDNDASLLGESPVFMRAAELLQYLKIAEADGQLRLLLEQTNGRRLALQVTPAPAETQAIWVQLWDAWAIPRKLPAKSADDYYWYQLLPEMRTLYVQYNYCANAPGNSFASFARSLFASADTQAVERVVVDLRGNGGGSSPVTEPLLEGLKSRPALSAKGHLYVLIGRGTCSSGMMAALRLWDGFGAILVGEPTGGKPNAYGDFRIMSLPNSRIEIHYSTQWFHLVGRDRPSLNPDVRAPQSLKDCLAGHDPALEAALRHTLR
jgi:hypothetical protein